MERYKGKRLLVTGGAGSIGQEIVRKLTEEDCTQIRVLDTNETALFELENRLKCDRLRMFIGNVRDKDRLFRAMEDVDIVFHAAALKHVPLCEYNPFEAAKTNVVGTENAIECALDRGVERFIMISTDKAVNPSNVMGATKLLAERLTLAANSYKGGRSSKFSVVRFGNVLNSRGSLLTTLKQQIENNEAVTLTHEDMTRFVMSIEEAVDLVLTAGLMGEGGEIFILKMDAVRIVDLIRVIAEDLGKRNSHDVEIKTIGIRPGEKLYEELLTEEESLLVEDIGPMYVLHPGVNGTPSDCGVVYNSNEGRFLNDDEIRRKLREIGYLE
ncbi:MAG TPA: polysaccharide biosynthesis protein [Methanomassiliicoccales archaeon]|nr:polysaccharide biosynthesis protein [Methanomassiliicoccales archaeon]